MRNKFDEQLDILNLELIKMGALCEEAIAKAERALISQEDDFVPQVIKVDNEIDQMERDIEAMCIRLLLQHQPVASDLRLISAAMKMVSDMERIGDQAANIAEISQYTRLPIDDKTLSIGKMARATVKMVTDSVDSFVNRDLSRARAVIQYDDVVDDLFTKVKGEIISFIAANPTKGEEFVDYLMIAKYFERIGDHATNIAEWVEFSMTGLYKGETL